uniref:Uncharacterized protein n=1 Tax=Picea sitchensis TaxID=3332 RepID=A0A6B9XVL2_PICSI|nr:hypothetical protein Q903MT_gene4265 [Picea sitchensis]
MNQPIFPPTLVHDVSYPHNSLFHWLLCHFVLVHSLFARALIDPIDIYHLFVCSSLRGFSLIVLRGCCILI